MTTDAFIKQTIDKNAIDTINNFLEKYKDGVRAIVRDEHPRLMFEIDLDYIEKIATNDTTRNMGNIGQ